MPSPPWLSPRAGLDGREAEASCCRSDNVLDMGDLI